MPSEFLKASPLVLLSWLTASTNRELLLAIESVDQPRGLKHVYTQVDICTTFSLFSLKIMSEENGEYHQDSTSNFHTVCPCAYIRWWDRSTHVSERECVWVGHSPACHHLPPCSAPLGPVCGNTLTEEPGQQDRISFRQKCQHSVLGLLSSWN